MLASLGGLVVIATVNVMPKQLLVWDLVQNPGQVGYFCQDY